MLIFKIVVVFFIFNCCLIVNNFNVIVLNFFKMFSFYWIFDEEKKWIYMYFVFNYIIILILKVFCKECYFLKVLIF